VAGEIPAGISPTAVKIVDLDSDGRLDYVAASYQQHCVSWIAGDGAMGALGFTRVPTPAIVASVAVADLDADGRADVATLQKSGTVAAYLGDGAGGLQLAASQSVAALDAARIADVNSDGIPDLVAVGYVDSVEVLLGLGNGAFQAPASHVVSAGQQTRDVVAGDWNLDGAVDVAVSVPGTTTIVSMLGNGSGNLTAAGLLILANDPETLTSSDLDDDGRADVATVSDSCSCVTYAFGDGAGGFVNLVTLPTPASAWGVGLGDVNGDGLEDAATAMQQAGVQVFHASGPGAFAPGPLLFGATQAVAVRIGDVDLDGLGDLVVGDNLGRGLVVMRHDASGILTTGVRHALGAVPNELALGDFDADGRVDVACACGNPNVVVLLTHLGKPAQSTTLLGSGTPGCAGRLGLAATSVPTVNQASFAIAASNAPQSSLGLLLVGDAADAAGSDPLGLGVLFHVNVLTVTELLGIDLRSGTEGLARAATPIPNAPVLAGKTFTAQAFFLEAGVAPCDPSPFGLVSSRGLSITVLP
jgi:hypothetical protein